MTVAELSDKLQVIAHNGQAQLEVKNVDYISVTEDGVFLLRNVDDDFDDGECPPGCYQN